MDNLNKKFIVYKHTHLTKKLTYIGITCQKPERRWQHGNRYKKNPRFFNDIQKYGWDSGFSHEILYENLSKDDACKKEIELIDFYKSSDPNFGYNLTYGGDLNIPTEETRKKLSDSHKGKIHNGTFKKGCTPSTKGKPRSQEVKDKISKTRKEKYSKNELEKYEFPVIRMDIYGNEKEYPSAFKGAEDINFYNGAHITECCIYKRVSAGGYFWRYSDSAKNDYTKILIVELDTLKLYFKSFCEAADYFKINRKTFKKHYKYTLYEHKN